MHVRARRPVRITLFGLEGAAHLHAAAQQRAVEAALEAASGKAGPQTLLRAQHRGKTAARTCCWTPAGAGSGGARLCRGRTGSTCQTDTFSRACTCCTWPTGGGGRGGVSAAADDAAAAQLKPDRFELREEKKLLVRIEFAACIVPAA